MTRVAAAAIFESPSAFDEDTHATATDPSAFGGDAHAKAAAGNFKLSASSDVGAGAVLPPSRRVKRRGTRAGKKAKRKTTMPPA